MAKILMAVHVFKKSVLPRIGLVQELLRHGHDVTILAPEDDSTENFKRLGVKFKPLFIDTNGTNPLKDIRTLLSFYHACKEINPALIINYTIKPAIYGGIVASILRVPYISVLTGLGSAFISQNWVTSLVKILCRYSQLKAKRVLLLNKDDATLLTSQRIIKENKIDLLPEGIDMHYFSSTSMPTGSPIFLFIGRVIADKGIVEYVNAARIIRRQFPDVRFQVLGTIHAKNNTAIPRETFDAWLKEGIIEYLGEKNDVRPYIRNAHCIVLPSYREGVPIVLLEAAAMSRPIIATNVPGCKEVVDHGVNGFLCRDKNVDSLCEAISNILELDSSSLDEMGKAGRKKIEREFNLSFALEKYNQIFAEVGVLK